MTLTHDKQHKHNAKPTKHATIMRGVVAPIFGLLAVLFIVLGALNATVWKSAREVNANAAISGTRYVVTDPGMLNLLSKSVNLKVKTNAGSAKASSQSDNTGDPKADPQTCVALGSAKDATGWLAGQNYTRVTGLDGWKAFSTKTATGPKLANAKNGGDEVAFKDSDMWTSVRCADNAIALTLNDAKSDQVMIIDMGASAAGSADNRKSTQPSVSITMHWVRDQVPDHATPFFIAGGICVLLTILSASIFAITANESFRRKRDQRRKLREKAKAEEVSISEAMTGSIAVLRTSLVHTSHNHRPSHKVRSVGDSTSAEPVGETAIGSPSNDALLFTADSDADDEETTAVPSIIDPTRRNLVADMQMQNDTDEDGENTDNAGDVSGTSDTGENAEVGGTVGTGEAEQLQKKFGRHRGKAEQEPEPETQFQSDSEEPTPAGRHSRHISVESEQPGPFGQSGQSRRDAEPAAASVAVSLNVPDSGTQPGTGEHAEHGNSEARRASSADELIDRGHSTDETDVISMDDLRDYFARFSQETVGKTETLARADGQGQDAGTGEDDSADASVGNTDEQKSARRQADQPKGAGIDQKDGDDRSRTAQAAQEMSGNPSVAGQDGETA
ncbi:hypothetical protein [Bifidobacterium sp. ESL0745]|uniref:hypothetical protein n=1 Tax=Bifidobacterium sp. ESL0745 TaxID=2983226 RepID=UPI0023F9DE72|nr:hypothetical protein [Bifidobacterium sp. ESL0745]MDF7665628.1 hypothetical protein [Bifidobacterium sp. ESL0745]